MSGMVEQWVSSLAPSNEGAWNKPKTVEEAIKWAIQESDDLWAINLHDDTENEMVARVLDYIQPFLSKANGDKDE